MLAHNRALSSAKSNPASSFRKVGRGSSVAVLLIIGVLSIASYSSSSANSGSNGSAKNAVVGGLNSRDRLAGRFGSSSALNVVLPLPFATESIVVSPPATRAPGCTNPALLCLGETVSATVSNAPLRAGFRERRIVWVAPDGSVPQVVDVVTDPQTDTYALPTSGPFAQVGTWSVRTITNRGGAIAITTFEVGDPTKPSTDLSIAVTGPTSVSANSSVTYTVAVTNNGPDSADHVTVYNPVPFNSTFSSATAASGYNCVTPSAGDVGAISCGPVADPDTNIEPSLAASSTIVFTFTFTVNSDVRNGDAVYEWARADTTTNEPDKSNNLGDIYSASNEAGGGGSCDLTCPEDINVIANTTEDSQRGAHVTFGTTTGNGDCGTITTSVASGSFFPVGVTVVTSTSENNGGSCSFTVTVEDQGTNPPTISCPAPQTANADSSCQASITIGSPTVSGNNATVSGTRSDGQPLYNCDCFPPDPTDASVACDIHGACTRRADIPFSAGVTTITWIAYSHDVAGPYANPDDEVAHRTGAASCTQTIIVNDVTPPTITAGNTSASADANCMAPVPDYSTLASVSDNCACASSDTSQICDSRQDIVVTQSPAAGSLVGLGAHTITLTANDGSSNNNGAGNTTTIQVTFTVNDTTPPVFTFVPPTVVAYTGPGATTCDTVVSDAVLGTATATDNCGTVTITRSPSGNTFPVGNTTVTWTARDGSGNTTTATQTVTVIDNTAPVITLNGNTPSMWPPNHKYQTFTVTNFVASVFDNCGGVSVGDVKIDHVTSDETENGNGDGNTVQDIVIASDCKSVQLRSERDGGGDGRVYTITFTLTDTHGNTTLATANVVVPHNPGETPVNSGVHYTVNSGCQ
jgi:uncharacterized repeat protein (TIGR01451 family)